MRLLDRYLLRELLIPIGVCLGAFLIFWIAFDLFGSLSHFQEQQLQVRDVARLYWYRLPEFLVLILPIVLLCSLLYTLTNHARHNELTAIRAAGQGLWRICLPYFSVGLLFSFGVLAMNEKLVPDNSELADQIETMDRRPEKHADRPNKEVQKNFAFRNGRDGRFWVIGSYDTRTHAMVSPHVDEKFPDGSGRSLMARRGEYLGGVWMFYDAQVRTNAPGSFAVLSLETNSLAMPDYTETPDQFRREMQINRRQNAGANKAVRSVEMPIVEILDYLNLHPDLGSKDRFWLHTQLQDRLAKPWTCLVVVLVAIPFGAASGRRNVFVGVASAIVICFCYFILQRLGLALGTGGYLPARIAAWLPNISFGLTGLWMTLRVR